MKLSILSNNIAVVFGENVSGSLNTDPIESKIATIYSEKSPKTVVAKFPGQVNLFIPEVQISIFVIGKNLIITDQTVGDFSKKNVLDFAKLVNGLIEIIDKEVVAYGFNFVYELENNEFNNLTTKLKNKFFKVDVQDELPDRSLTYVLPTLVFDKGGAKITVKFTANLDGSSDQETNKLNMVVNAHFAGAVPDIENLDKNYRILEQYISTYANSIFN